MSSLLLLIPVSILLLGAAAATFIWAVQADQFNDLERQGMDILTDDPPQEEEPHS